LRYRNPIEKGVYWYWFSKLRKLQDFITYGVCISCGRTIYELNSDAQAGHYYPASNCGFALLFHRKNVNLECSGCNGFDEGHLIGYGINLKIRYGEEIELELLQLRHKPQKEWSRLEYVQKIEEIRKEYDMLLSTSNL
jgi:DNA-directed RNA polymerase subunit RPC12/RpoP